MMRYRLLARSGLRVSELCLGAMVFDDQRVGLGASRRESPTIVERFAQAGGNFIKHEASAPDDTRKHES